MFSFLPKTIKFLKRRIKEMKILTCKTELNVPILKPHLGTGN